MSKMYKFFNYDFVRVIRRTIRKNQRIYIDIVDEKNIIRISKSKRYVIMFIDDFIDFI